MKPADVPDADALARVRALAERPLRPEEVERRARGADERGGARRDASLVRWFMRRYPTPGERLAYARRAYRRWTAAGPRP